MRRRRAEARSFSYPAFLFLLCLLTAPIYSQDLGSLQQAIRSGTSEQKRSALYEIKMLATEQASRLAIPALTDNDLMVRATAASAIISLPQSESAVLLQPMLSDKSDFVRREAAYALGENHTGIATSALVKRMLEDKVPEVRTAAAVALGNAGDTSSLAGLTAVLKKKPTEATEFLRRSAARSIGQIALAQQVGSTQILTPKDFLPAKFKMLRTELRDLSSGSSNGFQEPLGVLLRVLQSAAEAADTRREAAFAIGAIGSRSSVPVLSKYVSDPDPYLAEICKEALLRLR